MDTNLVQSLINIMECQLEEAFEDRAAAGGAEGGGGKRPSMSKRRVSAGSGGGGGERASGDALDPKVSCTRGRVERERERELWVGVGGGSTNPPSSDENPHSRRRIHSLEFERSVTRRLET